ncbi:MAG: hypothetical protein ACE5HV_17190 [Acidobacteriota bacterium]
MAVRRTVDVGSSEALGDRSPALAKDIAGCAGVAATTLKDGADQPEGAA